MKSGKTVLFVSHNTSMIMQVCTRCILLDGGRLIDDGQPQPIVENYLSSGMQMNGETTWHAANAPTSPEQDFRLRAFRVLNTAGQVRTKFDVKEPIVCEAEWDVLNARFALSAHVYVYHESGVCVFVSMDNLDSPWRGKISPVGHYRARCVIPADFLNEGMFNVEYLICTNPTNTEYVTKRDVASFRIVDDMQNQGVRGIWAREWPSSILRPYLQWTHFEPTPLLIAEANTPAQHASRLTAGGNPNRQ